MIQLSVISPLYNEEENVHELVNRILKSISKFIKNKKYQIVLIDNGSSDNTSKKILELKSKHVKLVKLSRNFGYYGGIHAGLNYSDGLYTVIIDGDLQDPPEIIEKFYHKITKSNVDCVYGIRNSRTDFIVNKILIAFFYRFFNKISPTKIPLDSGEFCIISKRLKEHLISFKEQVRFNRGLRSWLGFQQLGVKYDREDRFKGKGVSNLIVHSFHALNGIVSFSNFPLRIISFLGLITLTGSFISFSTLFIYWISIKLDVLKFFTDFIYNLVPAGFNTFGLLILIINLYIVLSLSIFSVYLSKIFEETKNRPNFIVDEIIDF